MYLKTSFQILYDHLKVQAAGNTYILQALSNGYSTKDKPTDAY